MLLTRRDPPEQLQDEVYRVERLLRSEAALIAWRQRGAESGVEAEPSVALDHHLRRTSVWSGKEKSTGRKKPPEASRRRFEVPERSHDGRLFQSCGIPSQDQCGPESVPARRCVAIRKWIACGPVATRRILLGGHWSVQLPEWSVSCSVVSCAMSA